MKFPTLLLPPHVHRQRDLRRQLVVRERRRHADNRHRLPLVGPSEPLATHSGRVNQVLRIRVRQSFPSDISTLVLQGQSFTLSAVTRRHKKAESYGLVSFLSLLSMLLSCQQHLFLHEAFPAAAFCSCSEVSFEICRPLSAFVAENPRGK